ncbi:hypothetical protein RJT34_12210 [Clitoria ternatea]|uniref:Uncharacterized protein n=1 Tax=Clitoria ternatea TaxID=43366 RepID=A0AAN9JLI6_CLITE
MFIKEESKEDEELGINLTTNQPAEENNIESLVYPQAQILPQNESIPMDICNVTLMLPDSLCISTRLP